MAVSAEELKVLDELAARARQKFGATPDVSATPVNHKVLYRNKLENARKDNLLQTMDVYSDSTPRMATSAPTLNMPQFEPIGTMHDLLDKREGVDVRRSPQPSYPQAPQEIPRDSAAAIQQQYNKLPPDQRYESEEDYLDRMEAENVERLRKKYAPKEKNWEKRPDGTKKGTGFLGPIETRRFNHDTRKYEDVVMTEYSIGVPVGGMTGEHFDIPSLVPGLTADELYQITETGVVPESAAIKSSNHAKERYLNGLEPYYEDGLEGTKQQTVKSAMRRIAYATRNPAGATYDKRDLKKRAVDVAYQLKQDEDVDLTPKQIHELEKQLHYYDMAEDHVMGELDGKFMQKFAKGLSEKDREDFRFALQHTMAAFDSPEAMADARERYKAYDELYGDWLMDWKVGLRGAAADLRGLIIRGASRAFGGNQQLLENQDPLVAAADQASHRADIWEEEAGKIDEMQSYFPAGAKRGLRGAIRTLPGMYAAGMATGGYGAIAYAMGTEWSNAIRRGKEAGLKGQELENFAALHGLVEGIPAAVMQKIGLGGAERAVAMPFKQSMQAGVKQGLAALGDIGIQVIAEISEEVGTEWSHNLVDLKIDPDSMSPEQLSQTTTDTMWQTIITMGFTESPHTLSVLVGDRVITAQEAERLGMPDAEKSSPAERRAWMEERLRKARLYGSVAIAALKDDTPSRTEAKILGMPVEDQKSSTTRQRWFVRNRDRLFEENKSKVGPEIELPVTEEEMKNRKQTVEEVPEGEEFDTGITDEDFGKKTPEDQAEEEFGQTAPPTTPTKPPGAATVDKGTLEPTGTETQQEAPTEPETAGEAEQKVEQFVKRLVDKVKAKFNGEITVEDSDRIRTGVGSAIRTEGLMTGVRQGLLGINRNQIAERLARAKDPDAWQDLAIDEELRHADQHQTVFFFEDAEDKWDALPKRVKQAVRLLYDEAGAFGEQIKIEGALLYAEADRIIQQINDLGTFTEEALFGKDDVAVKLVRRELTKAGLIHPAAPTEPETAGEAEQRKDEAKAKVLDELRQANPAVRTKGLPGETWSKLPEGVDTKKALREAGIAPDLVEYSEDYTQWRLKPKDEATEQPQQEETPQTEQKPLEQDGKGRNNPPTPISGGKAGSKTTDEGGDAYYRIQEILRPSTREELQDAIPYLRLLYPEYADDPVDPWGIGRAVQRGDELPRVPTVDLSRRVREAIESGRLTEAGEILVKAQQPKQEETPAQKHESGITIQEVIKRTGLEEDSPALDRVGLPRESDPQIGEAVVVKGKKANVVQVWRTDTAKEKDGQLHVYAKTKDGEILEYKPPAKKAPKTETPKTEKTEETPPSEYKRKTPREGEKGDKRTEWKNRMQAARDLEISTQKEINELRTKRDKLRKNAYKKRQAITNDIRALEQRLTQDQREFSLYQDKLSEAEIEDYLEKAPTKLYQEAGLAELARIRQREWNRQSQEGKGQRNYYYEKATQEEKKTTRHEYNVQAEFLKRAQSFSDRLNKDEITGIAERAARDFTVNTRTPVDEILEREATRQIEARPKSIAKPIYLNAEEAEVFNERMREAATASDWYEKQQKIKDEAHKADEAASAKRQEERAAEDKKAAQKAAIRAKEELRAAREQARKRGKDAAYWGDSRKRGMKRKGKKETVDVEIDGKKQKKKATVYNDLWAVVEGGLLVHLPSDKSVSFNSAADAKHFMQFAEDLGMDWNSKADAEEASGDSLRLMGRAFKAYGPNGIVTANLDAEDTAKLYKETPDLGVTADVILDSFDLGAHGTARGMTDKGVETIKSLVKEVPEFAYNPVFVVDGKNNLVFRDHYVFRFPTELFNLHPSEVETGQTVGINLPDLGIPLETNQLNVISKVLKNNGYTVQMGRGKKAEGTLSLTVKGVKYEVYNDQGKKWLVQGKDGATEAALQKLIDGIHWDHEATLRLVKGRKAAGTTIESKPAQEDLGPSPQMLGGETEQVSAPSGTASKPLDRPEVTPKTGSDQGRVLQPVQMPELYQIAKELMDGTGPQTKKLRGEIAGVFKGLEGVGPMGILIDPSTAADEEALAQTLAHEIGHLIDFLPDNTLRRGNLLGRLQSLRDFLKSTLPALDKKDLARISRQAKKEAGKDASKEEIDAIRRRIFKERGLIANKTIQNELIELTKWWSGDFTGGKDSYVKYRKSSRELYAEALSVFLNSPGDLESRAPTFYRTLLDHLNAKPEVLQAYSTLQQMLNGTGEELAESRTNTLREMFGEADAIIRHLLVAEQDRRRSVFTGVTDLLGQYFLTSAQPIQSRLGRKPQKHRESSEAEAARYAIDELFTIDSPNHTFLRNIDEQVQQPFIEVMENRGLSRKDAEAEANFTLGEYLFHWRVANERDEIANSSGFTATTSTAQLDAIRTRIGDVAYAQLQKIALRFHDLVYAIADEAANEGVYNRKTFDEVITPNKDNYAAFRVTKYIDDPDIIATGVIKQVGTFSDIQNPYHATVLKVVRLNRLIEMNRAKNRVRVFLENNFSDDIREVETVFTGVGKPRIPRKPPRKGYDHLVELVDGHPVYYEVPTEIAKSFSMHDIGGLGRIASIVNSATYKIFHPFFVTYNPGFVIANPFRDLRRTWVNLGATDGISLRQLLVAWAEAIPTAIRREKGIEDQVIKDMIDNHALDIPYTDIAAEDIDSQIDSLFQKYGLREKPKRMLEKIPVIGRVLSLIEHTGAVTETATKVAGWKVLEEKGVSVRERAYKVRKYVGTPDYKQRGLATGLTNSMMMYSRVRWNGLQADLDLATNPETAAGWWWRQVVNIILPTSMAKMGAYGAFGYAIRSMFGVDDDDDDSLPGKFATWTDEAGKRIAKYFLTDYDVFPMGIDENGKAVFITIPRDDLGKIIARVWWHATDLAQLAAGGELREGTGARDAVGGVFADVSGELIPSFSPPIEIASKWLQYGNGINPNDPYFNQQIVPYPEWTSGGWSADSKMIAWTLDKFGAPGALIHYPLSPLLGETFEAGTSGGLEAVMKTVGAMTGLKRLIRVSDSGLTSAQWAMLENADQEEAAFRLSLPKSSRKASTRRYLLMRRKSLGDTLSEKEENELHSLNLFYNGAYLPLREKLKEGGDGDSYREDMKRAADDPMALISNPPASIKEDVESYLQSVVYSGSKTKPELKNYKNRPNAYKNALDTYKKTLPERRDRMKALVPTHRKAQEMLYQRWTKPDAEGRKGRITGDWGLKKSYRERALNLARLYGEPDPAKALEEFLKTKH